MKNYLKELRKEKKELFSQLSIDNSKSFIKINKDNVKKRIVELQDTIKVLSMDCNKKPLNIF